MADPYDIIIIGSGPGGYVAAIKAAQLGMHVAVVEKEDLGGICLNWGCIPTKALLQSAKAYNALKQASNYGIQVQGITPDLSAMIQRSRSISSNMHHGIEQLLKKHRITLLKGIGKIVHHAVSVTTKDHITTTYPAKHIILATGAKSRQLPHIPIDGIHIMGYRDILTHSIQPKTLTIIGGGAIGCEFAYFYHTIGTKVTLIESQARILSLEDEDISKYLLTYFKKSGIKVYTNTQVTNVHITDQKSILHIHTPTESLKIDSDLILVAAGIDPNLDNLGLEENAIQLENGKIAVDTYYQTSCPGIYAIGDIIQGPALAHVASMEGIICVEKIAGLNPEPLDYHNIPTCVYTHPEVASVGYSEKAAKEAGYQIKVGLFPFSASGKAQAIGKTEGFVKVIFDAQYGQWLGAHMIGENVTEMIAEVVVARKLETTAHEMQRSIHPHPTMSEAIIEAISAAYGEAIHI